MTQFLHFFKTVFFGDVFFFFSHSSCWIFYGLNSRITGDNRPTDRSEEHPDDARFLLQTADVRGISLCQCGLVKATALRRGRDMGSGRLVDWFLLSGAFVVPPLLCCHCISRRHSSHVCVTINS